MRPQITPSRFLAPLVQLSNGPLALEVDYQRL
jgi:hypothetical protein